VADEFDIRFVQAVLFPAICESIHRRHISHLRSVPKLARLIIAHFGSAGLAAVEDLLVDVAGYYIPDPEKSSPACRDLYLDIVATIPGPYRDDVAVERAARFAASTDPRLRVLAVSLLSLIARPSRAAPMMRGLAADAMPCVRAAAVAALSACSFDPSLAERLILGGARDPSAAVRRAAASVFGSLAPHLTGDYLALLAHVSTTARALDSFAAVAEAVGLGPLLDGFARAARLCPDKGAHALIACASRVKPGERHLLYRCARVVRHAPAFIAHVREVGAAFAGSGDILKFFRIEGMATPAERVLYARQANALVPELRGALLGFAIELAKDPAQRARCAGAELLAALYRQEPGLAEEIAALANEMPRARRVLATVVGVTQLPPAFWEVARRLAVDSVPEVRTCLARGLRGTQYFSLFFGECGALDARDPR